MKDTLLASVAFSFLTLTLRAIPVGTREAPLGVNGAGLETVSGDVRLSAMDAEYDVASDTLVKFDGSVPMTNEHCLVNPNQSLRTLNTSEAVAKPVDADYSPRHIGGKKTFPTRTVVRVYKEWEFCNCLFKKTDLLLEVAIVGLRRSLI